MKNEMQTIELQRFLDKLWDYTGMKVDKTMQGLFVQQQ